MEPSRKIRIKRKKDWTDNFLKNEELTEKQITT